MAKAESNGTHKVDAGFERLARKLDALANTRRAPSRRRKG